MLIAFRNPVSKTNFQSKRFEPAGCQLHIALGKTAGLRNATERTRQGQHPNLITGSQFRWKMTCCRRLHSGIKSYRFGKRKQYYEGKSKTASST
jgi:hypothetical protein